MNADDLDAAQGALAKLFPSASEMAAAPSSRRASSGGGRGTRRGPSSLSVAARSTGSWSATSCSIWPRLSSAPVTSGCIWQSSRPSTPGQPSEYNQLLHTDYPNHTLTVPRPEAGYHQMETFIYLSDVGLHNGATRLVSRTRTSQIPVEEHTLNWTNTGRCTTTLATRRLRRDRSSYTDQTSYHRSMDFTDPATHASCCTFRISPPKWNGAVTRRGPSRVSPWNGTLRATRHPSPTHRPRVSVPGHRFWTEETLDGVARRYPGLDLGPWRVAYASRGDL